jgi:hypothetical protein
MMIGRASRAAGRHGRSATDRTDTTKGSMMGKWTDAWRAALRESRRDTVQRKAPRDDARAVIRARSATFDGRVLRISSGQMMPAGRTARRHEKNFWRPVEIAASQIVSVRSSGWNLRVVTTDGREYRFVGSREIADAIMAAIA